VSGDTDVFLSCDGLGSGCGTLQFNTEITLLAYSNPFDGHQAIISLGALTQARSSRYGDGEPYSAGSAQMLAFADPYIEIDPDWAAAHPGYSVVMSDGIVNGDAPVSGGVPEPAAWALMITGFGLAGAALRRRRITAA
jgi:hypothetical protein